MEKKIKLLFLSAWYPHRYDSMAGLFVRKHAEALSLYCDVSVLYVHADEHIKNFEIVEEERNNINELIVYFPVDKTKSYYKFSKLIRFFRAYWKGYKFLKKKAWRADIVHVNVLTRTGFIAYLYKKWKGTPYVVTEHWSRYLSDQAFQNSIHKKITQLVVKEAAVLLPVTAQLRDCMLRHGLKNENYRVINNVVDGLFFEEREKISLKKKKRILNVTCFEDESKNLSGLVAVAEKLYEMRQDFELYMVGDGADFEKIKKQLEEKRLLNSCVFLTGVLEGRALVSVFQDSDFSVLFSNRENIPVVISESLVCGLPFVSTNVGGVSEHINESNGLLVEKGDEKAFLAALNYMLDNSSRYDGARIKELAREKYSYERVGKEIFEVYQQVLGV